MSDSVEIDAEQINLKEFQEFLDNFFLKNRVRPQKIEIPRNLEYEEEFLAYCKSMNIKVVYND